jgi:hypothetical protein
MSRLALVEEIARRVPMPAMPFTPPPTSLTGPLRSLIITSTLCLRL